jgi:hypothetical protein
MSVRNIAIALIAIIALLWVLFKGITHAWVAMHLTGFMFILAGFLVIAWLWGRFSK